MTEEGSKVKVFVCSILMIAFQLFLSPIISINSIVPNFLLAFTISCTVALAYKNHLILAFILGLFSDIFTNGSVGVMSISMLLVSFFITLILSKLDNITLVVSILIVIAGVFCSELIYGIFQMSLYTNAGFMDILAYKVLPCTLFDSIIAVIIFPIVLRFFVPVMDNSNFIEEVDNTRW